jgi:hypothetical protein
MSESPRYHLVCRECPKELVVKKAATAERRASDHEAITGHRLAFKQVA